MKIDCHFVQDAIIGGIIDTPFVPSLRQLTDIFTKGLLNGVYSSLRDKLRMFNVYAPT